MLLTTSTSPDKERSPVSIALRKNCLDCIQSRCSAPLRRVTMNSVIENESSVPNTTEAVFASTVWAAWHQKSGNQALRAYTRFPDTPCSSQQRCVTPQNLTPKMPHYQSHTELAQGWPVRCWHCHDSNRSPPQPHGRNCPAATSSQTPKCGNHGPQIPAQTACASSPTRQPEPETLGTFHSEWLTETNKWANM